MGTLLTGITLWVSDSATISGISHTLVDFVIVKRFAGISLAFFYAVAPVRPLVGHGVHLGRDAACCSSAAVAASPS